MNPPIPTGPPRIFGRLHSIRGGAFVALAILAFTVNAAHAASAATGRLQISDGAKIVSVSDPQFSPDGKSIVFMVSRRNMTADRTDRELVLFDVVSGSQRPLTFDRRALSSPRWSPSGDRLAFLADDGGSKEAGAKEGSAKEERAQVWVLALTGGDA